MRRLVAAGALLVGLLTASCGSSSEDPVTEGPIGYGDDPSQFGVLDLPDGEGPFPVVVLVHGGFWRREFALDLMTPLATDLVARGYGTWNLEYRRVGQNGGGWPGTFDDVAAGVDRLTSIDAPLDLDQVAIVGHSAGGHLALWLGQRTDAAVEPKLVVGQAPVPDLVAAANAAIGGTAVPDLLGGSPAEIPDVYAAASPAELLPVRVPQLIVHGETDTIVPSSVTVDYAARVGDDDLTVELFSDSGHFDVIDPAHDSWRFVVDAIATRLGE